MYTAYIYIYNAYIIYMYTYICIYNAYIYTYALQINALEWLPTETYK